MNFRLNMYLNEYNGAPTSTANDLTLKILIFELSCGKIGNIKLKIVIIHFLKLPFQSF